MSPTPESKLPETLSREQWLARCAARLVAVAGLDDVTAMDYAGAQLENLRGDLTENPEQAADDEMDCWTPD